MTSAKGERTVLLSLRDYVMLAAPEPEVLKILGEESRRKGTNTLTLPEIDRVIRSARRRREVSSRGRTNST